MAKTLPLSLLFAVAVIGTLPDASAQTYPDHPLRLVVPFAAGGTSDILARFVGPPLSAALGQPVVIDNRPGAGSNVGNEIVAKAAPDGYTLIMATPALASNQALYGKLNYDPIANFAPVTLVAEIPIALVVHPSMPTKTVRELIALAKAQPGKLNFGSSGNGTVPHLAVELFKTMAAVDLVHVPYKGAGPAVADLLGGGVQLMTIDISLVLPHVRGGRLKGLAVTGAQRSRAVPALPTIAEAALPGYEILSWYGVAAPKRTPATIVARLNSEIGRVLSDADTVEKLTAQGIEPFTSTPEQFGVFIVREIDKFARIITKSGAKVD